jgi:ribonuclease Z
VILGDTYDPSAMVPLCINPSPSLLIHEATDSPISPQADPTGKLSKRSAKDVHTKALSRGHSTPEMAGAFAKLIGARDLVLNHIGGR